MNRFKAHASAPVLLIVILGLKVFLELFYGSGSYGLLAVAVVTLAAYALPAVFYILLKGRGYAASLRLGFPKASGLLLAVAGSVTLIAGVLLVKTVMVHLGFGIETAGYGATMQSGGEPLYILLAFILVPALCEELVFRGIMLSAYETYGPLIALGVSSVMGAIAHLSIGSAGIYLLIGFLLGAVTYAAESLMPAVVIHCMANLNSMYCDAFLDKVLRQPQNLFFFTFLLAVAFLGGVILLLYAVENSYIKRGNRNAPMPVRDYADSVGVRAAQVFLSPTFLLCAVAFAVANAFQLGG